MSKIDRNVLLQQILLSLEVKQANERIQKLITNDYQNLLEMISIHCHKINLSNRKSPPNGFELNQPQ